MKKSNYSRMGRLLFFTFLGFIGFLTFLVLPSLIYAEPVIDTDMLFTWHNFWVLITAIFGIAMTAVSNEYLKLAREFQEVAQAIRDGKDPSSEMGSTLSPTEKQRILNEGLDVYDILVKLLTGGVVQRIAILLGKAIGSLKFW